MFRINSKSYLIWLTLAALWGVIFWLQPATALTPAKQLIGVPALLVLSLLLAALAQDSH